MFKQVASMVFFLIGLAFRLDCQDLSDSSESYYAEFLIESPDYEDAKAIITNLARKYSAMVISGNQSDFIVPKTDEIRIKLEFRIFDNFVKELKSEFEKEIKDEILNQPKIQVDSSGEECFIIIYWKKTAPTKKMEKEIDPDESSGSTYMMKEDNLYELENRVENVREITFSKPDQEEIAIEGEKFNIKFSGMEPEEVELKRVITQDGLFIKLSAKSK